MHLGLPFMSTACPLACRLLLRVSAMRVCRTPETIDEPHGDDISRTLAASGETIPPTRTGLGRSDRGRTKRGALLKAAELLLPRRPCQKGAWPCAAIFGLRERRTPATLFPVGSALIPTQGRMTGSPQPTCHSVSAGL